MMISPKMAARLNKQVIHEHHNAWSYLAMAYWFETAGLKVFAKFFSKQAEEERGHAEKISKYLIDQGAEVTLTELDKPKTAYKNALDACQTFVQLEIKTTKMVHEVVDMAIKEGDHATRDFIDWKVAEQVEEVATANELLGMVKLAGSPGQILMLEGRVWQMMEKG
jgi:ferritin